MTTSEQRASSTTGAAALTEIDLAELSFGFDDTVEGVTRAIIALRDTDPEPDTDAEMMVRAIIQRLYRVSLDWMVMGREEEIRSLLGGMRSILYSDGRSWRTLRDAPLHDRTIFKIEIAAQVMTEYLGPSSLPRLLASLAPYDRRPWCDALKFIAEADHAVACVEFFDKGIFPTIPAAEQELDAFCETGIIERAIGKDPRLKFYQVTFAGMEVYRALMRKSS